MPEEWKIAEDGDMFYGGICICPHGPEPFRVGYDWGLRVAVFDTLEAAKTFAETQAAEDNPDAK